MPKAPRKPKPPRGRRPQPEPNIAGAKMLQSAIHIARAKAGIPSDAELARLAPVSYDTLMNWFSGSTRPRGAELQRVAKALDVPYAVLDAAYEGRDPEPPPLTDAVAALTVAVQDLVDEIRKDREAEEGLARGRAADEALRSSEDDGSHAKQSAPRGTKG